MYPSLSHGSGGERPQLNTTTMAGPVGGGSSGHAPLSPTHGGAETRVRVEIAEEYRIDPPVPLSSIEAVPASSNFQFDFAYEHRVVRRGGGNRSEDESSLVDQLGEELGRSSAPEDPLQKMLAQYKQMGYTEEAVSMAAGMYGVDTDKQETVIEFCSNYQRMKEMGFSPEAIAGALVINTNDARAATEQLMSM
mmetsp:Transcript_41582/g.107669  ORF Transcript_41582/g.107669 Transcript_41582/m.107669 type:complete len:193 (-) Transcript_41582:361-939(-)|eukprot:jgi/Tetstr1/457701/TSEL_044248.t1